MSASSKGFDYIVVGAGSAGCALAARLSEDPSVRVLLLEAGPEDRHWKIHLPPGFPELFKTRLDWAFHTEPEDELGGRRLFWPRGKVLGGSSSINAMLYIRGHRKDYDHWRDLGNPGWGFDDVLPYFRRGEHQERGVSELHGVGGPLNVAEPIHPNPLSRAFVEAGKELGWRANDDFNGPRQEGVGLYQVTQREGRRASSAVAYLRPARQRPNLEVRTTALVRRVLFDGRRAVGVEIGGRRGVERIEAGSEVVLAAGAVGSPHLLMLSGVGSADALAARGISVVTDLPGVGQHLQDHPVVSVIHRSREPVSLDHAKTLGNMVRYFLRRQGPLTTSICEGGAFIRSGLEPADPGPDLQFHFLPAALRQHGFDTATDQGVNLGVTLIRPRSVGEITLGSADPSVPPKIRPRYLSDPRDLNVLLEGVKVARRLTSTKALGSHLDREVVPGPEVQDDAGLEAFIRETVETLYHPAGTCRMGPASQASDMHPPVVDPELKVHDLEGLRVADASVMPELIAGNTNAPTMMIAEKASDLIRGL